MSAAPMTGPCPEAAAHGRWGAEYWWKRSADEAPAKPDADVLAICRTFSTTYARAKMLKALSYGLPVETATLLWCLGVSEHAGSGVIIEEARHIKLRIKGFQLVAVYHHRTAFSYRIDCAETLASIRAAMTGGVA